MKKVLQYTKTAADVYHERLSALAPDLYPYWAVVRSHVSYEAVPLAGAAYFYSAFANFRAEETLAVVDLTTDLPVPEVFWDWQSRSPVQAGAASQPAVKITVNGRFAGYYLPYVHTLLATDWTHNTDCVRVAKQILPALIKALHLRPLTQRERGKYLAAAGVEVRRRINPVRITVGCDPEFELWRFESEPVLLQAHNHLRMDGALGTDGAGNQVELRPEPGTPRQVVSSLKQIIQSFVHRFPDCDLDAAGHHYPCGGHIHFGGLPGENVPPDLIQMLDDFIGWRTRRLNGKARGSYGHVGDWRSQAHGFEYRTPPAAVFANPKVARIVLKLARNLVTVFYSGKPVEYNNPPQEADYVKVGGLTENEAEYFLAFFSKRQEDQRFWIRAAWGLGSPVSGPTVIFRDEWLPQNRETLYTRLKKLPKRTKVVLYGLSAQRGSVATIPGIPGADVLSDPPRPPRDAEGNIWIGLPWNLRMQETDRPVLEEAAAAIARYCRSASKGGEQ